MLSTTNSSILSSFPPKNNLQISSPKLSQLNKSNSAETIWVLFLNFSFYHFITLCFFQFCGLIRSWSVRNCLPSPHTFHHISVILKPVSLLLHVSSLLHVSILLHVSSLLYVSSLDVEYIYKSVDNSLKSPVTYSGLQVSSITYISIQLVTHFSSS